MKKETALQRLSDSGIIAVIRAPSDAILLDLAKALIEGGVIGIEVTMSTPKAIAGIQRLADALGEKAVLGVGTVLDPATAADAIHAGAEFVVSPILDTRIIETARRLGKAVIPGAFTPTEIFTAWSAGADWIKVYPATTLGPAYFKDLLAPMPFLKLAPSGGVDLKSAADWIKAGAVCLGAGSSLINKEACAKGDWPAITATARQFSEIIKSARSK